MFQTKYIVMERNQDAFDVNEYPIFLNIYFDRGPDAVSPFVTTSLILEIFFACKSKQFLSMTMRIKTVCIILFFISIITIY